ncbi:MAG TPA: hypothetical protein VL100_13840 [Croceibacterium sp.]|nr:hypothetical protein [Croceibacterium sp.]
MADLRIGAKLARGEPVFGTFVKLKAPAIVELLGIAGFDFAILDAEHGCFTHAEIENLARAGELVGIGSVVRVADASETGILHALDAGASGGAGPLAA